MSALELADLRISWKLSSTLLICLHRSKEVYLLIPSVLAAGEFGLFTEDHRTSLMTNISGAVA